LPGLFGNCTGGTPVLPPNGTTSNALQNFQPERFADGASADRDADLADPETGGAAHLNLSVSWLAKRRLAGDGPTYVKLGGAVRYAEAALQQWMKAQQRTSTSG
jgi:predicted DNA-binding transcriptional regulator AlpA